MAVPQNQAQIPVIAEHDPVQKCKKILPRLKESLAVRFGEKIDERY